MATFSFVVKLIHLDLGWLSKLSDFPCFATMLFCSKEPRRGGNLFEKVASHFWIFWQNLSILIRPTHISAMGTPPERRGIRLWILSRQYFQVICVVLVDYLRNCKIFQSKQRTIRSQTNIELFSQSHLKRDKAQSYPATDAKYGNAARADSDV